MNSRKFERTECQTEAVINYKGTTFKGEVDNLSLKGLFVKTEQKIPVNEQAEVTIYFHGLSSDLSFSLQGTVVRNAEDGIGFNFQKIDIDSLALLNKTGA
ncbi:PilZ domain-containing protein [Geobacter sp. DSM 9736]|uniref:PilZ domain-containing protein n=1 Tax=Geobacter sp. DSM 9736 TaxID=1277350 RepID=UPI000B508BD2|nr:PilZ domain-containing protein [Geobacter sp. DSM 9736]SNB46861.1 PilZ domain-containing protein [Geobacter sp. DSM 9736]